MTDHPPAFATTTTPTPLLSRGVRLAVATVASACLLHVVVSPAAAGVPSGGPGPGAPPLATVETIAGPGFCVGDAEPDRASTDVHALAVADDGHVYFDTGPLGEGMVASVAPDGTASAVRTGIRPGDDGEGGPTGAAFTHGRLAVDDDAGLFIADRHRVVRFDVGPTTIAGNPEDPAGGGGAEAAGDGGRAKDARFTRVHSLTADEAGNIYVADEVDPAKGSVRIRFVNQGSEAVTFYPGTPDEITVAPEGIDTIAGGGDEQSAGDGGPAVDAVLDSGPPALAVRGSRLYLSWHADATSSGRTGAGVRLINLGGEVLDAHGVRLAPGAVATVAGGDRAGYGGDGGPARSALFSRLPGMSADDQGNLLVADQDNHRIRNIDADGVVTTVAGSGATGRTGGGFNGNGQPAIHALLKSPFDVKVAPAGGFFVSDRDNGQVRMVDAAGTIRAWFGNGVGRSWLCRPSGSSASPPGSTEPVREVQPSSLAVDEDGGIYIGVPGLRQVKRIDPSGSITTVGQAEGSAAEGVGIQAQVPTAQVGDATALAMGAHGGLYVADRGGNRVRVFNPTPIPLEAHGVTVPPGSVRVVAGNGEPVGGGDGGRAVDAALRAPAAVVADGEGNLIVAPGMRHIDAQGTITTLIPFDKMPTTSCCQQNALELDEAGNLYFAEHARVWFFNRGTTEVTVHGRRVDPGAIEVVAGTGLEGFEGEGGPAVDAQLNSVGGLAADSQGNLYVGAGFYLDNAVRRIDAQGILTSIAGRGAPRFNGDHLRAELTALSIPTDLAFDSCGDLVIAEAGNQRVRRVDLAPACTVALAPASGAGAGASSGPGWSATPVVAATAVVALLAGVVASVALARRRRPSQG